MGVLDEFLTRAQLAKELNVTTRTLDRWAWLGTGPAKILIGSKVYYHRDDVAKWLEGLRAEKKDK